MKSLTQTRIERLAADPKIIEIGQRFHDILDEIGAIHGNNFDAQMAGAMVLAIYRARHMDALTEILERSKRDESQPV